MEAAASPEQQIAELDSAAGESAFSLELTQDQKDIRDWVHGSPSRPCGRRRRNGTSGKRLPGR